MAWQHLAASGSGVSGEDKSDPWHNRHNRKSESFGKNDQKELSCAFLAMITNVSFTV